MSCSGRSWRIRRVVGCAALMLVSSLIAASGASAAPCGHGSAIQLGSHPQAALQPTSQGKEIQEVQGFSGRVYFGYGDYDQNTGPITMSAYDPAANGFLGSFTFSTEAVDRFRNLSAGLYAAATDPSGAMDVGYAFADTLHSWSQRALAPAALPEHVFDIAERTPGELYLAGSSANAPHTFDPGAGGATVWKSTDGGATWETILTTNYNNSPFSRFYGIGALNGKIYVTEDNSQQSWVYDGASWTRGPILTGFDYPQTLAAPSYGGGKPSLFNGQLVWLDPYTISPSGQRVIRMFDGTNQTVMRGTVLTHEVAEGKLLTIEGASNQRKLWSTTNGSTWTCQGSVPSNVRSVGLLSGVPYFGGDNATIYKFDRGI